MNKLQVDIKKKVISWSILHNLQLIVNYHNEQRKLMRNHIITIERKLTLCNNKSERKELLYTKNLYVDTFDGLLRINTFLMLYSQLEEYLYHIWKIYDKGQTLNNSGSLQRFKKIIGHVLIIDLSQDHEWNLLCDYEKVRNCILHANGRISISKNKKELETIINKSLGHLSKKKDRIELTGKFLESVANTIESLIKRVEKDAN